MTQDLAPLYEGTLYLSKNIDYFQNGDDFFVYHNLYGYILKMSEDLVDFLEFFTQPLEATAMHAQFDEAFGRDTLNEFLSIFRTLACLLPSEDYEREKTLAMYPTQARWISVHCPEQDNITIYAFDAQSHRDLRIIALNDWESSLWRLCAKGDKNVQQIIDELSSHKDSPSNGLDDLVMSCLAQWTHYEIQALKLSAEPCTIYKGRRFGIPPYLISTMPYERVTPLVRTEVDENGSIIAPYEEPLRVKPKGMRLEHIDEETLQRDRLATRLSSVLATPHEVLQNQSYAQRIFACAEQHCQIKDEPFSVLDIGGGLGETAQGFIAAFQEKYPQKQIQYTIYAPNEEFAQLQREQTKHLPQLRILIGQPDDLAKTLDEQKFDFILCDEFLADLEAVSVRKMTLGGQNDEENLDDDPESEALPDDTELPAPATQRPGGEEKLTFIGEGDAIQLIFKHKLRLNDAPEDFYLNSGSLRLLSQIQKLCKFSTQVFLIEFGEEVKYPVRTFEENSVAYSQHFGVLRQAAQNMGFTASLSYWMQDLDLQRDTSMFATTRSQFKALRRLLADHNVNLQRQPYTETQMRQILSEAGLENAIVELNFEPAEDRISGLVPHSYRLLRLFKEIEF